MICIYTYVHSAIFVYNTYMYTKNNYTIYAISSLPLHTYVQPPPFPHRTHSLSLTHTLTYLLSSLCLWHHIFMRGRGLRLRQHWLGPTLPLTKQQGMMCTFHKVYEVVSTQLSISADRCFPECVEGFNGWGWGNTSFGAPLLLGWLFVFKGGKGGRVLVRGCLQEGDCGLAWMHVL